MDNIKNKQPFFILGLICLGMVLILILAARPLLTSSAKIYKDIKNKKEDLKVVQQNLESLQKFKEEMAQNPEKYQKIASFVPKEEKFTDFVVQIEAAATATENNLDTIKYGSQKTGGQTTSGQTQTSQTAGATAQSSAVFKIPGTKEAAFNLKITGKFGQLVALLSNLEKLSRANSIYSINIDANEKGEIITDLVGAIFYQGATQ